MQLFLRQMVILARSLTFHSGWTALPRGVFLSKVFFRHLASAPLEQERTILFSFHSHCRRGGSCQVAFH